MRTLPGCERRLPLAANVAQGGPLAGQGLPNVYETDGRLEIDERRIINGQPRPEPEAGLAGRAFYVHYATLPAGVGESQNIRLDHPTVGTPLPIDASRSCYLLCR